MQSIKLIEDTRNGKIFCVLVLVKLISSRKYNKINIIIIIRTIERNLQIQCDPNKNKFSDLEKHDSNIHKEKRDSE